MSRARWTFGGLVGLLWACVYTPVASARAELRGIITGSGFNDPTPVQPVAGNPGTTLGEQRRLALQRAFALWGDRLDTPVVIEVAFEFEALGCMNGATILGGAGPVGAFGDVPGGQPGLAYVSALANSLAGRDLDPEEPDIVAHFNSSVDRECKAATGGFYYGFDAKPGDATDFIAVVLHELAHGLGITALVDVATGESAVRPSVDSYTAQLQDLKLGRAWSGLSATERKASAASVRGVVWGGAQAARLVGEAYALGSPTLALEPALAGWLGAVADVAFARNPAGQTVTGPLVAADSCEPSPARDSVVLFPDRCKALPAARAALAAGAAGAVIVAPWPFDAPAMPIDADADEGKVELPVLSVTAADAASLRRAARLSGQRVTLGGNASQRIGADERGRPFMFASQPVSPGSTISHLEELARPNQLMEPFASKQPTHVLGFTTALLRDAGWKLRCGNGQVDQGELCDDGDRNSDARADACRSDCQRPRCGDGVRDRGEGCDALDGNDDTAADRCRTDCMPARCGDGVLDRGEECDRGKANSDTQRGACRTACRLPHCGDSVIDPLEECDDGANNSDADPDTCRSGCRSPRCGDGVVDRDEVCDEGPRNSATRPGACRPECQRARCGDHVVDEGEVCDSSPDCGADCQSVAVVAARAEPAEPTSESGSKPDASSKTAVRSEPGRVTCGCRAVGSGTRSATNSVWIGVVALLGRVRLRRSWSDTGHNCGNMTGPGGSVRGGRRVIGSRSP